MELAASPVSPSQHIVSYFEHHTDPHYTPDVGIEHLTELQSYGFDTVALCLTEADIASQDHLHKLELFTGEAASRGLRLWVDFWSVGGITGGEGGTSFTHSCMCNPQLDKLLRQCIDITSALGADAIFWDEPEMKCNEHRGQEVQFLEKYTAVAGEAGLPSIVCLTADKRKLSQLPAVATLPDVIGLGTDPYYPNVFEKIDPTKRLDYVAFWSQATRAAAEAAGKRPHIWIQGFDIPPNDIRSPVEFANTIRQNGVQDIAFWGFRACTSVPEFQERVARYGKDHFEQLWHHIVPHIFGYRPDETDAA